MAFLQLPAPGSTDSWSQKLQGVQPQVDRTGCLAGCWGECLVEAVIAEHSGFRGGAAGQVIDFLNDAGHGRFEKAADKLERLTHSAMKKGGLHCRPRTPSDPDAWAQRQGALAEPTGQRERSNSVSSSSSSNSGSSSGSGLELDPESQALCQSAPLHARVFEALDRCVTKLPDEVHASLVSMGACVTRAKHLKTSAHSTWLVDLEPPLRQDGKTHSQVIVQVIGAEIGDRPLSLNISMDMIVRAMELARLTGVRVPDTLSTGYFDTEIGKLGFIAQEFVQTQTVEDEVIAPRQEWLRLGSDVVAKLRSLPPDADPTPLVSCTTLELYLRWLRSRVPAALEQIHKVLDDFASDLPSSLGTLPPMLIHQDINGGNLLASQEAGSDRWTLDAVIDWESAIVGDPRLRGDGGEEPWGTAELLGSLTKGAYLAGRMADGALPRCDLEALVENYTRAAQKLATKGLLSYQTWASLVQQCKGAIGTSKGYYSSHG
eukprot:TRINITY_DN93433_c0_g1_i1.p1 TRINITY_DN93433_c0_g1~~TRINITY_DN93433_c0_g1_i1.p1  ORF type:complete len:495 (-),score=93.61 TRINITY_DN93433_c0_g1_i1:99-1562(-)